MSTSKKPQHGHNTSRGYLKGLREIVLNILIALLISFVIRTFFFRAFVLSSVLMENTLHVNYSIFVILFIDEHDELKRGDIIVFEDQLFWLPPLSSDPNPVV